VKVGSVLEVQDRNRHIKKSEGDDIKKNVRCAQREASKRQNKEKSPTPTVDPMVDLIENGHRVVFDDSGELLFFFDDRGEV
jgi:hypothetical protein